MDEHEIHDDRPSTIGEYILVGTSLLVIVTLTIDAVWMMGYAERIGFFYWLAGSWLGATIISNYREFKNPHGIHDE